MKTLTTLSRNALVLLLMLCLAHPPLVFASPTAPPTPKNEISAQLAAAKSSYQLGYYGVAIPLLKACMAHAKETDAQRYLQACHILSLSYFKKGEYANATLLSMLGTDECVRLHQPQMEPYFEQVLGLNTYIDKRYEEAIVLLQNSLPAFVQKADYENAALTNLYIAKSYTSLQQDAKAIRYYKAVAGLFKEHHYTHPDLRMAFETLISYYGAKNDSEQQSTYVNQLLQADAFMKKQYRYLNQMVPKQYDTEELLQLQRDNTRPSALALLLLGVAIVSVVLLSYWYYRRWKAEALALEEIPAMNALYGESAKIVSTEISAEAESSILKKLEKFERDKRFLERDLTLVKVAQLLDSNTRYVAAIIAKHRNKRIIDYINDLKIDHMIALLQQESKYRNYTQKAMAEEVGFGTTQHFTRAFTSRTAGSVSAFLQKLEQEGTGS